MSKTQCCINCGSAMSKRSLKYCSYSCQHEFEYKQRLSSWLSTGSFANKPKKFPPWARSFLLERNNFQCSRCGWGEINPYSGKISLEVEHIDGNPYNNDISNLTILCPNCHSLTPSYKALNKGNGREWRRKQTKS